MDRYHRRNGGGNVSEDDDDVLQLERERHRNDQKLKARFEHIFSKYEHDFHGIGDEIDLTSGDIVVNNGHLQYMRHEVDPGKSASSRFVRTFQEKLEEEDDSLSDDDDEDDREQREDSEEEDDGDEDDDATLEHGRRANAHNLSRRPALLQAFGNLRRPAPRLARILVDGGTPQRPVNLTGEPDMDDSSSLDSASDIVTPSNVLNRVPGIQQSMQSLKAMGKRPAVNDDAIQALGVSIANQLAQLMAGPGDKRKRKKKGRKSRTTGTTRTPNVDPIWAYPELNIRPSRPKRRRSPSPVAIPFISSPHSRSPGEESLWAPEGSVKPSKRRRMMHDDDNPVTTDPGRSILLSSGGRSGRGEVRRCWNCSLTNTPNWRQGPHGQDLCSSCGKYFDLHRRMKPFDSPTPSMDEDDNENENEDESDQMGVEYVEEKEEQEEPEETEETEQERDELAGDGSNIFIHSTEAQQVHSRQPPVLDVDSAAPHDSQSLFIPEQDDRETKQEEDQIDTVPDTPNSGYPANTSRPLATSPPPTLHNKTWTAQEDALLIKLKEIDNQPWPSIACHFPGRSPYSVQRHYSRTLCDGGSEGREILRRDPNLITGDADSKDNVDLAADRAWNRDQDKLLRDLRDNRELSWAEISHLLPGHTAEAVTERYRLLVDVELRRQEQSQLREQTPKTTRPKGMTAEEDALIIRLKEHEELSWVKIAKHFPDRTLSTVQKRYSSHLAPQKRATVITLPNDPIQGTIEDRILAVDPELDSSGSAKKFDPSEDALMKELREQKKLQWETIAARMPGRTAKALEHRYQYNCHQAQQGSVFVTECTPETVEMPFRFLPSPSFDTMRPLRFSNDDQGNQHGVFQLEQTPSNDRFTFEFLNVIFPSPTPTTGRPPVVPAKETTSQQLTPAPAPAPSTKPGPGSRRAFTDAEDNILTQLRGEEGKSWEEIAISLPGRSVRSIIARDAEISQAAAKSMSAGQNSNSPQTSKTQAAGLHKRKSLPARMPTSRSSANPLLRKALDNSLRRRSDQALSAAEPPARESKGSSATVEFARHHEMDASQQLLRDWPSPGSHTQAAEAEHSLLMGSSQRETPRDTSIDPLLAEIRRAAATVTTQQTRPSLISSVEQIYQHSPGEHRIQSLLNVASAPTHSRTNKTDSTIDAGPSLSPADRPFARFHSKSSNDFTLDNSCIQAEDARDYAHPSGRSGSTNTVRGKAMEASPRSKTIGKQHLRKAAAADADPRQKTGDPTKHMMTGSRLLPAFEKQPASQPDSTSASDDESLGDSEHPDISFSRLLRVAFGANDSGIMRCEDIYDWVESNYEFYRLSPPSWKARIRAELSANPCFTRTTTDNGAIAWQLVHSAKPDESWGLTRGPRKKHERTSKQSDSLHQPPVAVFPTEDLRGIHNKFDTSDNIVVAPRRPDFMDHLQHNTSQRVATAPDALEPLEIVKASSTEKKSLRRGSGRAQRKGRLRAKSAPSAAQKAAPKRVRMSDHVIEVPNSDPDDEELPIDVADDELLQPSSPPVRHNQRRFGSYRDSESTPSRTAATQSSSSPVFVKPGTPASVYSKTSALRSNLRTASQAQPGTPLGRMGTPTAVFVSRSTPAPASSSRRFAETPVREVDSDEDELA